MSTGPRFEFLIAAAFLAGPGMACDALVGRTVTQTLVCPSDSRQQLIAQNRPASDSPPTDPIFQLLPEGSGPALTVSTLTLPAGIVNTAYSQTFSASGGTPPYSNWAVSTGALPAGLTLSSAGLLSGTPTKAASSSFKVTVTDSAKTPATATASLALTIAPALTISTASPLVSGKVNVAYTKTFVAAGGTPPYSNWTTNSTLPQGLTLSSTGILSGNPTLAAANNFTVSVSDNAGVTATASFQLTIAPGVLAIITPSPLPTGQVNTAYSLFLTAIGGTPPYTAWAMTSGALPPGLTFSSSGLLAGAPTTAGANSFTLQVTDTANATASIRFQLTITAPALVIAVGSPLPTVQGNVAYAQSMVATGGTPPYTWAASGTLPPGLTLSTVGVLNGTPTLWGTYSFTVQVTDHASVSVSSLLQLTINPGVLAIVTTSPLPAGLANAAYSQSMAAAGGKPPYMWYANSRVPGLSFSTTGVWSGTAAAAGTFNFNIELVDSAGTMVTAPFQATIAPNTPVAITTTSPLPAGNVSTNYSLSLAANYGTPPYPNWTVTAGSLPSGLTLSPSGLLSGNPQAGGTFSFTVQVTDSGGVNASAPFQLTINASKVAITTTSPLPVGRVNAAYSQTLAASGGTPPYSWVTFSVAPGLTLSSGGVLSGTPTTAGSNSLTIQVTDSASATVTTVFQLVINPASLAITTTSPLPAGKVNTSYSQTLAAGGGTPPYTNWTTSNGTPPSGLTLSSAGVLSGTPANASTSTFTVQVTDSASATASTPFQLTISPSALAITTASPLPVGHVSTAYSQILAASGGTPPYNNWTTSNGALPSGLTLSSAGVLSGTPTNASASSFTIQVTDSAGATASTPFQLTINAASLAISTTSPLPAGKVNISYSQTLAASGGTPPYASWTVSNGALPLGLTLSSTGTLSGTPTNASASSFTVQVTDSATATASTPFQLTISSTSLVIATTSPLPAGHVNTAYAQTLAASGGTPPYTSWTTSNSTLPLGLTLSSAGILSGTPTTAGTFTFTIQVTDSASATSSTPFQLTISSTSLAITTTSPLPAGHINTAYAQILAASGGTPPYTNWTTTNSTLPLGLTLSSAGILSGLPTSAGTFTFTIQVTDSASATSSTPFQLIISSTSLAITTTSPLPAGQANSFYSQTLTAGGGTPPYTNWTTPNSTLPSGLTLSSLGILSGTPTSAGTFTFTIQVTDSANANASTPFQLTIAAPPLTVATISPLPAGQVNTGYAQTLTANGGTPPYTGWTTPNSTLPTGLTLSSAGVLSGTPTSAGTFTFTIQVTDSAAANTSTPFQLTIAPAPLAIATTSPLPAGQMNTGYSLALAASGGTPPYSNWTASNGAIPPGLTLSPAGVWSGAPVTAGSYSFTIQLTDSAGASASAAFQLTINQPLPSVVAVVNSANVVAGLPVTTGAWVALYGANLAPAGDSRMWNSATEIVNGNLPSSLDGTSVTVNGKPAAVEYISPGQVNIQLPDDTAVGPVTAVVTTAAGGAGTSFTVTYAQFSPGFFPATAPYIAAQHADNSYVTASAPAQAGEVIVLWGGGMGPASPAVPAGQVFVGANPLANTVGVTIGGQPAMLDFAGVVGAGLVQINAHVPTGLGAGDQPIVATVGGVSSPSGAYISIGTPGATSQLRTHALLAAPSSANPSASPTANFEYATRTIVPPTPIYAGTDNGIYKSIDGGATWHHSLPSSDEVRSINSIVVDPRDQLRIYAAGVNYSGGDTFFTSLDAGETWSRASAPPAGHYDTGINVFTDPANAGNLYMLADGLFRSTDGGATWSFSPVVPGGGQVFSLGVPAR